MAVASLIVAALMASTLAHPCNVGIVCAGAAPNGAPSFRSSRPAFVPSRSPHPLKSCVQNGWGRRRKASELEQTSRAVDELADDDLVALPFDSYVASKVGGVPSSDAESAEDPSNDCGGQSLQLRLCVVRNSGCVYPLVRHEDDVETDLFLDPRHVEGQIQLADLVDYWSDASTRMRDANEIPYFGVGWYGQRPVPSLGGGPGYGAEADEIWSVDEDVLEVLMGEGEGGVDVPTIDVGMAHGEKARGGALF